MICPRCGDEYRPGFTQCAECHIPLVDELPQPEPPRSTESQRAPDPYLELVTVFESGNAVLTAIAKSVLLSAEIPFAARGEQVQELFGLGRFPGGVNLVTGPVCIEVASADRDVAAELLDGLGQSEPQFDDVDDSEPDGS